MYFMNDLLTFANFIRLIALIPLYPFSPHFEYFIFLELSGNAESSHCIDICVEIPAMLQIWELLVKLLDN